MDSKEVIAAKQVVMPLDLQNFLAGLIPWMPWEGPPMPKFLPPWPWDWS